MPKMRDPPTINLDGDGVGTESPETKYAENDEDGDVADLLDDLIALSEQGEISHTVKYLKKAKPEQLQKIKTRYDRKQAEETNKILSEILISQYSQLLLSLDLINSATDLEEELSKDKLLKRELVRLLSIVTPHVPLLGLVSGGIISAKHAARHKFSTENATFVDPTFSPTEQQPESTTKEE